jgi:hypothetical protein
MDGAPGPQQPLGAAALGGPAAAAAPSPWDDAEASADNLALALSFLLPLLPLDNRARAACVSRG